MNGASEGARDERLPLLDVRRGGEVVRHPRSGACGSNPAADRIIRADSGAAPH